MDQSNSSDGRVDAATAAEQEAVGSQAFGLAAHGRALLCGSEKRNGFDVKPSDVHVVRFCLDESFPRAIELLDSAERERAARFVYERDRRRFVTAHAWMRTALAKFLGCPAQSLCFDADAGGKPRLVGIPIDLRFNLSHAGERALLAIAIGQEVGIDIELVRSIETLELARRFFSRGEVSALRALSRAERVDAFFRCWTRKEAFIKAVGAGLSFPLDGFEVDLGANDGSQQLRGCAAAPEALSQWRVVSLTAEPGYQAALAAGPSSWHVVRWNAGSAGTGLDRSVKDFGNLTQ